MINKLFKRTHIKYKTLQKAVNIYEKLNFSKYDSLNTVNLVKDFLPDSIINSAKAFIS